MMTILDITSIIIINYNMISQIGSHIYVSPTTYIIKFAHLLENDYVPNTVLFYMLSAIRSS